MVLPRSRRLASTTRNGLIECPRHTYSVPHSPLSFGVGSEIDLGIVGALSTRVGFPIVCRFIGDTHSSGFGGRNQGYVQFIADFAVYDCHLFMGVDAQSGESLEE